jgi:hypothetical protein
VSVEQAHRKAAFLTIMSHAAVDTLYSWRRGRLHFNIGLSLAASPARLRVSQGRTALRSVAHSAMRPHRGVAPRPPVCPPREHVPPRPVRSRRSIRLPRPVGPFACSGRANLPSKHTHMSVEAYPPDGPQISPRQGSQNFSARAGFVARGGPVREGAHVSGAARGKLLRPASRRLRRP